MLTIHTGPDVVPDNAIQWCNVRFVRDPNRLVSFVRSFGRYNSDMPNGISLSSAEGMDRLILLYIEQLKGETQTDGKTVKSAPISNLTSLFWLFRQSSGTES